MNTQASAGLKATPAPRLHTNVKLGGPGAHRRPETTAGTCPSRPRGRAGHGSFMPLASRSLGTTELQNAVTPPPRCPRLCRSLARAAPTWPVSAQSPGFAEPAHFGGALTSWEKAPPTLRATPSPTTCVHVLPSLWVPVAPLSPPMPDWTQHQEACLKGTQMPFAPHLTLAKCIRIQAGTVSPTCQQAA